MDESLALIPRQQVEKFIGKVNKGHGLEFAQAFSSTGITEDILREMPEARNCSWDPVTTTMAFVSQVIQSDKSCRNTVMLNNARRLATGKTQISSSTGAYVLARQRLPVGLMETMSRKVAANLEKKAPLDWLWRDRNVKIVDGSTLTMADTAVNQAEWPQHGNQEEGLGFPLIRIVALLSLATGAVLGHAIDAFQGKGTGEHALFRRLFPLLKTGDILLGDSYYPSWFLLHALIKLGIDGVFAQHGARITDFRTGKKLGPMDHLVSWPKPQRPEWMTREEYSAFPDEIKVREVQSSDIVTSSGEQLLMVTTMTDPESVTPADIEALYGWRWNGEIDLRNLKTTMAMEHLSCKSPDMVRKELEAHMLAYNLIRLLMCQSSAESNCKPRQLSFKAAVQSFNAFSLLIGCGNKKQRQDAWTAMLAQFSSHKVGNRPNRSEPRAIKKRPRTFPRLKTKRSEYHKEACF